MKKRGIFFLFLVFVLSPIFGSEDITDLGSAYELTITGTSLAQAETNSSSSVSVITREQIEKWNLQTTAEIVAKAIGTSFNSYGGLGSLQTVVIRGATSSKNTIFLDGVSLSSAHDGTFDLSIIPPHLIDRIEIIKSGPGNLGRINAVGGMVNIITKKGERVDKPFSLTLENGSFLPLSFGAQETRNWLSLVDSQRFDLTYTNATGFYSVGALVAQNAYTYEQDDGTRALRKYADMYGVHGNAGYTNQLSDITSFSSQNVLNYQHLGVPGSTAYETPDDYQENLLASTVNTVSWEQPNQIFEAFAATIGYTFSRTLFHDDFLGDSTHNSHKGSLHFSQTWNLGEFHSLTTGAEVLMDVVDSSDLGKQRRLTPALYANGSIYTRNGSFSLHPSANLSYISDIASFSPNASIGAIYNVNDALLLRGTFGYAENQPSFSDLYWPLTDYGIYGSYEGNPDLETEKGLNGDIGMQFTIGRGSYDATLYAKNIYNAIVSDGSMPQNIAHSFYIGTEQSVTVSLSDTLEITASYILNRSFDLSSGQTFSDNIPVPFIRRHMVKAAFTYSSDWLSFSLDGQYASATQDSYATEYEHYLVMNAVTDVVLSETLSVYLAIDNLLNRSYSLVSGYPMPGMKIRLGGAYRF